MSICLFISSAPACSFHKCQLSWHQKKKATTRLHTKATPAAMTGLGRQSLLPIFFPHTGFTDTLSESIVSKDERTQGKPVGSSSCPSSACEMKTYSCPPSCWHCLRHEGTHYPNTRSFGLSRWAHSTPHILLSLCLKFPGTFTDHSEFMLSPTPLLTSAHCSQGTPGSQAEDTQRLLYYVSYPATYPHN